MKVRETGTIEKSRQGRRSLLESRGRGAGNGPPWSATSLTQTPRPCSGFPLTSLPSSDMLLPQECRAWRNTQVANQDAAAGRLNPT